ncbi:MAG TPA: hypothetical protein VMS60_05005 [Solirubrobacterales bacterium]|nr:hypothetical protein [Solirubrobacterales bacterium]
MTRPKLTFANAIALIALFIALGGTVYAAAKINGRTIRKGSIPADRLKTDSLTGLEINEQLLGTVPSAVSATTASHASQVAQAMTATRAARATKAGVVEAADSASHADEAEHAKQAARAARAPDTSSLGGVPAGAYLQRCADQTVLAAALIGFLGQGRFEPLRGQEFTCAGGETDGRVTVRSVRTGETIVKVTGVPDGIPIVTPLAGQNTASVTPLGSGEFRVTTDQSGFLGGDQAADAAYMFALFRAP